MTHTRHPWRIGDAGTAIFGPPNGSPAPYTVASRIRHKADAHLIRTAPELLEALKAIDRIAESAIQKELDPAGYPLRAIVDRAFRAIARAEGRA